MPYPSDMEGVQNPQAQVSLAALFVISIVILVVIAVIAILFLGYTQPEKDHTTTITLLLGLLTPLLAGLMLLVSKQNDIAAEAQKERREARAQIARAQQQITQVGNQVTAVAAQADSIQAKSDEAVVTSRAGLAAMVKAKGREEFDLLMDKFTIGTLTLGETERLAILAKLRALDDLTDVQQQQLARVQAIVQAELLDPTLKDKKFVLQSAIATQEAKDIQAVHEVAQTATGARKEHPDDTSKEK